MHGFRYNLPELFSLKSTNAFCNICSGRLKVKVIPEDQIIKLSKIELVWAITSTFMHGFQNNLAQFFI